MESNIIGIIGIIISGATLAVMLFGIRLGKKAMVKNVTIFGTEARDRYKDIEKITSKELIADEKYEGGNNKQTPQLETERFNYDKTMNPKWKDCTQIARFYDKKGNDIWVTSWMIK